MRDPKNDPKVGDVLAIGSTAVVVVGVTDHNVTPDDSLCDSLMKVVDIKSPLDESNPDCPLHGNDWHRIIHGWLDFADDAVVLYAA